MSRGAWSPILVALGLGGAAGCGRLGFEPAAGDAAGLVDAPPDALPPVRGPGSWTPLPAAPLPATVWTRAVWTGADYLVLGGALDPAYTPTQAAARFDPASQTWTAVTTAGAPVARHTAMLARAGAEVFVYGGAAGLDSVDGGGIYDASADAWQPLAADPGLRTYAAYAAAGSRIALWSGLRTGNILLATGLLYDRTTATWTPMAPSPLAARVFAAIAWTGTELVLWGGCSGSLPACATMHGDGARYDPATDTWRAMSTVGAPSPRAQHVGVWTGRELIVWGGFAGANDSNPQGDGAIYDPATDAWRPMSSAGAPSPRGDAAAAWLGTQMIVWGSANGLADGALYDPATDVWTPLATAGAPLGRSRFAFASDGRELFVFGGSWSSATGARWRPSP